MAAVVAFLGGILSSNCLVDRVDGYLMLLTRGRAMKSIEALVNGKLWKSMGRQAGVMRRGGASSL